MGAKTWMLVYSDGNAKEALKRNPQLDRDATIEFAKRLFPKEALTPTDDVDLLDTSPPDEAVYAGCFDGVSIVAATEFAIDYPSALPAHFISAGTPGNLWLHVMNSVVDWFAYALWVDGALVRSLSLTPDRGVLEDIGTRLPFEQSYWAGRHPVGKKYPLPFHPLELAEVALGEVFGYVLEGTPDVSFIDPQSIPLLIFERPARKWWFSS